MPKVYITQEPVRTDQRTGEPVAKFDISPASVYGDVVEPIMPGSTYGVDNAWMCKQAHLRLRDMTADDYLVLLGDPRAVAVCVAVASHYTGGTLRLLTWSNRNRGYTAHELNVNNEENAGNGKN